jgi:tripartite-type tricarboxylate transporter receptor subunit TctC
LPYDTRKDFDPVILLGTGVYVLVINASLPAKTLPELIKLMKDQPDKFNAGFTGFGSPSHLGLVQFKRATGVTPAEVNYKGTGPAVTDLIGGQTQLMFTTLAGVLPNVESGRLRVIAVTSLKRSALLPDVPTAIEAGLPGFVVFEWYGLNAPKGTPREAIDRMNAEMRKVLAMPDVQERLKKIGAEPAVGGTPEEFQAFVDNEIEKWGKIVREANIKPE